MDCVVGFADGEILMRATSGPDEGLEPVGGAGDAVRSVGHSLAQALTTVTGVAEAVQDRLSDLTRRPDEVVVDFGLELNTKGQFIVVSSDAKATLRLQLTWSGPKS